MCIITQSAKQCNITKSVMNELHEIEWSKQSHQLSISLLLKYRKTMMQKYKCIETNQIESRISRQNKRWNKKENHTIHATSKSLLISREFYTRNTLQSLREEKHCCYWRLPVLKMLELRKKNSYNNYSLSIYAWLFGMMQ